MAKLQEQKTNSWAFSWDRVLKRTESRMKDLKLAATIDAEETAKEKATTEFLNELRESGITNMWGAGKYLENEFGVSKKEAKEILISWMKNFKK